MCFEVDDIRFLLDARTQELPLLALGIDHSLLSTTKRE